MFNKLPNNLKALLVFLTIFSLLMFASSSRVNAGIKDPNATGDQSRCSGNVVSFGIPKKFIPIATYPLSGRDGECMTPKYIIMHTTASPDTTAETLYEYFYNGAGGRGAGTQFGIGKAGDAIQMGETMDKQVDVMWGVANYNYGGISIELTDSNVYNSKAEVPPAQYQKAIQLVEALMKQYNIPVTNVGYGPDWISRVNTFVNPPPGIYGHYQLNHWGPDGRTDPGQGFFRDFIKDLSNGTGAGAGAGQNYTTTSNCVVTKVGNPANPPTPPPGCSIINTGTSGNTIADYAIKLAAAIKVHCPKINSPVVGDALVERSNPLCVDQISSNEVQSPVSPDPFPSVIAQIHANLKYFPVLQCVGFAQAVAIGVGAPLPNGNIAQNLRQNEPGYRWYSKNSGVPMGVGDFMIWDQHIAVVTKVLPNGWYNVVEANGDNGSVGNDSYPLTDHPYGLAINYLGFMRRDPSIK